MYSRFYIIILLTMIGLNDKKVMEFIEWYKSIYWDTSEKTWTWQLPHINADEEEEHIKMWKEKLTELLWPKNAKKTYTHKGWRTESLLDAVFSSLRLWYWPVVDWKKR